MANKTIKTLKNGISEAAPGFISHPLQRAIIIIPLLWKLYSEIFCHNRYLSRQVELSATADDDDNGDDDDDDDATTFVQQLITNEILPI